MNSNNIKNDFNKTRIIGYLLWFLIMIIGSQFISYFFDLGCLINNPLEDYKTINTIETIYVSFYVFGAIFFILILDNEIWEISKFMIYILSIVIVFGCMFIIGSAFLNHTKATPLISIILFESLILKIYSIKRYKVLLFILNTKLYKNNNQIFSNKFMKHIFSLLSR
jgi:hypothetical protein